MRTIHIGDRPLVGISEEHLRQIVLIEGCCPSPEYWQEPIVSGFDDTMFSDCIVLDYYCMRKKDGVKSSSYTFFLNTQSFSFHYSRDLVNEILPTRSAQGKRLGLESISFLIKAGYNIPL